MKIDKVKTFSASKARDRRALGDVVTLWLRTNPHYTVIDKQVNQSSDAEFHCITICLFCEERG